MAKNPVWQAVGCARTLMRNGVAPSIAIARAARKYDVDMSDVASILGSHGGKVAAYNRAAGSSWTGSRGKEPQRQVCRMQR